MNILFTASNSLMSKLIRKLTGEPFSHCAIELEHFVVHSDLLGVRVVYKQNFLEKLTNYRRVSLSPGTVREDALYQLLDLYEHSWYDYLGLLFLGLSFIMRAWFKIPLPKKNLWQVTGMFLCTEWVETLLGNVDSMITPYQLFVLLEEKEDGPESERIIN